MSHQSVPKPRCWVGVDIGGHGAKVGLFDGSCDLRRKTYVVIDRKADPGSALASIIKAVYELCLLYGVQLAGFGLAAPGPNDLDNGTITGGENFSEAWKNYPLVGTCRELLQESFSCRVPVAYDNDANAAVLGEVVAGAGRGKSHVVLLTFGTGIGGGIVINKEIYRGHNYAAGEVGHMVVGTTKSAPSGSSPGFSPCTCGRSGCLESFVSASSFQARLEELVRRPEFYNVPPAFIEMLSRTDTRSDWVKLVLEAAASGERYSQYLVDELAEYAAIGIWNIINFLAPCIVLLGGGMTQGEGGSYLVRIINKLLPREEFFPPSKDTPVVVAQLGNDAGWVGAASLARAQGS